MEKQKTRKPDQEVSRRGDALITELLRGNASEQQAEATRRPTAGSQQTPPGKGR